MPINDKTETKFYEVERALIIYFTHPFVSISRFSILPRAFGLKTNRGVTGTNKSGETDLHLALPFSRRQELQPGLIRLFGRHVRLAPQGRRLGQARGARTSSLPCL